MLSNLKIANKLSLIVISFVIPILILLCLLIETHQWRVNFASKEIAGNMYLRQFRKLQENIQQYHLDFASPEQTMSKQTEAIDTAIKQLLDVPKQTDELSVENQLQLLNKQWEALRSQPKSSQTSLKNLDALEKELRTSVTLVGDESNLILDPDLDTYYLMDATLTQIPKQVDLLTETMLFSQQILSNPHPLSLDEKVRLISLLGNLDTTLKNISNGLQLAVKHNKSKYNRKRLIDTVLSTPLQNSLQQTQVFINLMQTEVVQASYITINYAKLKNAGQLALSAQYALWDVSSVELDGLLKERISNLNTIKYLQLIAVILVLALSFLLCMKIVHSITQPLWNAQKIMAELATGNLELKVENVSEDETGQVLTGISFLLDSLKNIVLRILDATQKLIATFKELNKRSELILSDSEQIQLNTATMVLESNAINQSVNENVQELQRISEKITSLAAATEELSTNINTISHNSENSSRNMGAVTKNIEQVSMNIHLLSASAQQMSAALSVISESANETNQISSKANQNAQELLFTMNELNQSSKRIGTIVKLISNIAGKTNMLALNATIEAATAGEAGRGFAVVASEIKNLAQQTVKANNEIEEQIFQVQRHIQKALTNTETVGSVISRVAEINQKVGMSLVEEHQCADEIAKSVCVLADASKNASFNTQQAEQGLWEISRAVSEAFMASKEVVINIDDGNRELQSVTKRSIASLEQLKNVNVHIASIQESIKSIHGGNQHLHSMSQQVATHVDALKNSVSIFHINIPAETLNPRLEYEGSFPKRF
jgi:methyl-accepting chemotaxis protein